MRRSVGVAAGVILLAGCVSQEMPSPGEGAVLFAENCAMCHGAQARGNGELAKEIRPIGVKKPADLTLLTRKAKAHSRAPKCCLTLMAIPVGGCPNRTCRNSACYWKGRRCRWIRATEC